MQVAWNFITEDFRHINSKIWKCSFFEMWKWRNLLSIDRFFPNANIQIDEKIAQAELDDSIFLNQTKSNKNIAYYNPGFDSPGFLASIPYTL